jgi:hypothetical protein
MAVIIQLRRGTEAEWLTEDPVLMEGEVGVDTTNDQFRIGDGVNNWDDLPVAGVTAGGLLDGDINFAGYKAISPQIKAYTETVIAGVESSGDVTLDIEDGNIYTIDLDDIGAPIDVIFDHPPAAGIAASFTIIIHQDDPVRAVTWPAEMEWRDDDVPALDTAGATYILTFLTVDAGTKYYGMEVGEFDA